MRWIKDHLWILALVAVGGVAWLLLKVSKSKTQDFERIRADAKTQIEVIKAQADVAKLEAQKGAEAASAQIKVEHEAAVAKMDEEDKRKVEELSNDPEALIEHIVRVTR